jgi:hypothetical protein
MYKDEINSVRVSLVNLSNHVGGKIVIIRVHRIIRKCENRVKNPA